MTNRKELLREFLLMNLGTLLVSVGVYFFKFPNHFSMGGVSGLAVLLGKLLPQLSPSTFNTIINVLFLVLGFVMLNRGFGARTVYCSILSAGLIQLFEWAFPMDRPLTDQLMLELFFAVILPALGSAILFNIDASSGGTDIAAMILKKYTGLDVGRALLLSDVVIAAAALFVFDITAGLCSLLGLALKSAGGQRHRVLQPAQGLFRHLLRPGACVRLYYPYPGPGRHRMAGPGRLYPRRAPCGAHRPHQGAGRASAPLPEKD